MGNRRFLRHLNVVPMDIDGDGRSDLLHLPRVATYGWFTPTRAPDTREVSAADQGWRMSYGEVALRFSLCKPVSCTSTSRHSERTPRGITGGREALQAGTS